MENHSDIAIIGCGPAGAVAGAILAGKGYSVVIFDRDSHPRISNRKSAKNGTDWRNKQAEVTIMSLVFETRAWAI